MEHPGQCALSAVTPPDAWLMHDALDLSDGDHFDIFEFFLLRCLFGFLFSEQSAERTGLNKHFDITLKFLSDVQVTRTFGDEKRLFEAFGFATGSDD
jgi:hypothetical protein